MDLKKGIVYLPEDRLTEGLCNKNILLCVWKT